MTFTVTLFAFFISKYVYGPPIGGSVNPSILGVHDELLSVEIVFLSKLFISVNLQNCEQPGMVNGYGWRLVEFLKKISTPNSPVFLLFDISNIAVIP